MMISEFSNHNRIAVISDTHGYLASELTDVFKTVDLIIHAGDIDSPAIMDRLNTFCPVIAVRGNVDHGGWAKQLSYIQLVTVNDVFFYVLHDIEKLDIDPGSIGVRVVISGHTHRAAIVKKGKITYLNPGSASLPRGGDPPSYALIYFNNHDMDIRIEHLMEA